MTTGKDEQMGTLQVKVVDEDGAREVVSGASVRVFRANACSKEQTGPPLHQEPKLVCEGDTGPDGIFTKDLPHSSYTVVCEAFGLNDCRDVLIEAGCKKEEIFDIPVGFGAETYLLEDGCKRTRCTELSSGSSMLIEIFWNDKLPEDLELKLEVDKGKIYKQQTEEEFNKRTYVYDSHGVKGSTRFKCVLKQNPEIILTIERFVLPKTQSISGDLTVSMKRAATVPTEDLPLWVVIRKSTEAISFNNYFKFMNYLLCGESLPEVFFDSYEGSKFVRKEIRFGRLHDQRCLPFTDAEAYRILKVATEAFLIVNCGVALDDDFPFVQEDNDYVDGHVVSGANLETLWSSYLKYVNGSENQTLPYLALIRDKLRDVRLMSTFFADSDFTTASRECYGILTRKLTAPCLLELIWSYWHEEGMLVQTSNAISRRFQNVRGPSEADPLANLEIDPLRPLNNLLWGYIQDEQHRLSVVRRTYEYDHHYGLRLDGKAVPKMRPADSRSKFLEAFHNLLHKSTLFFRQDDDTTVVADGFPLLNALQEVHLILSQGAHNQFGDLPSTARIEMMMQQWLLARPEFREFLPTRIMVAYPEPWMDRVDAMKKSQGWTDTSVVHFRNLGMFGEQILLSIRYGAWGDVNDPASATNWARFWRPEIQGYIHAYRAVTGVDLTLETVDFALPSIHLRKRLALQKKKA